MAATDLKANFQNQMKEIDEKISQIQGELEKAREYKLKLVGGLETLELIEQQQHEENGTVPCTDPPDHIAEYPGDSTEEETTEE
jgi:hypothetical protein